MTPILNPKYYNVSIKKNLYQDLVHKKKYRHQTITDSSISITMDVHQIILSCSSDYFDRIFNFKEKKESQITIQVTNAHAVHDIILQFYGQLLFLIGVDFGFI